MHGIPISQIEDLPADYVISGQDRLILDSQDGVTRGIKMSNFLDETHKNIKNNLKKVKKTREIIEAYENIPLYPKTWGMILGDKDSLFLNRNEVNNGYLVKSSQWNSFYQAGNDDNYAKIYNELVRKYNAGDSISGTFFECYDSNQSYNDYSWVIDQTNRAFRTPVLTSYEDSLTDNMGNYKVTVVANSLTSGTVYTASCKSIWCFTCRTHTPIIWANGGNPRYVQSMFTEKKGSFRINLISSSDGTTTKNLLYSKTLLLTDQGITDTDGKFLYSFKCLFERGQKFVVTFNTGEVTPISVSFLKILQRPNTVTAFNFRYLFKE